MIQDLMQIILRNTHTIESIKAERKSTKAERKTDLCRKKTKKFRRGSAPDPVFSLIKLSKREQLWRSALSFSSQNANAHFQKKLQKSLSSGTIRFQAREDP